MFKVIFNNGSDFLLAKSQPMQRIFHEENLPNLLDFKDKPKTHIPKLYDTFWVGGPQQKKLILFFFYFHTKYVTKFG